MEFRIPGDEQKSTTFDLPSGYDDEMEAFISKTSGNEKDDRDRLPTVPANKNKKEATKNDDKSSGTGETVDEHPDHLLQFPMDMGGRRKSKRKKKKKKRKTKKKKRKPHRKSRKRRRKRKTKRKFRNQRGYKR
tara:strand:- start:419 stop:817 length:399 start_codon:yes stop_codon:yes gene_type:complete